MKFKLEEVIKPQLRKRAQRCKICRNLTDDLYSLLVKYQGWFDLCADCKEKIIEEEDKKEKLDNTEEVD